MRYSFLLVLLVMMSMAECDAKQSDFEISRSGLAKVSVVVSHNATVPEKTAARELCSYLATITGADFVVSAPGSAEKDAPRILIGQCEEARRLVGLRNWKELGTDGILIQFVGNDLVIAGDRPRGTIYAVYTFLEDYIGCKWWTPQSSYIPKRTNLAVRRKNLKYNPAFMYREAYFTPVDYQNGDFAAKIKLNGTVQTVPEEFGGHLKLIGFVHTFDVFLPASVYFKDHPEWYSLYKGKRVGGQEYGGLCLTNEEMKAEFTRQVMKAIEKDPKAGMISISQNDGEGYCECDRCSEIVKREGSQSGLHIMFVNSIAEEIEKNYPGFLVETLAYQYTRQAPKHIKPRHNVIVRLCSIECDFARPLNSGSNAAFYKDLKDWQKICKRLFIWDYTVNYGNMTIYHPNWNVLSPNIRLFASSNVKGILEQGDGWNNGAAFGNMKLWVLSKLMWNPRLDAKKLMREFADGYYGPAGKYLYKFLEMSSSALEKSALELSCFAGSNVDYMGQREMDIATDLFDKAELAVASNQDLLNRVKIERLALDHTWILQAQLDRSKAGRARGMDMKALCEDFISRSKSTGNVYINESAAMSDGYYEGLRSYAAMPYVHPDKLFEARPEAVRKLSNKQWIDLQDNKITVYMPGTRGFIVADPDASDGKAIMMPGKQLDWAVQMFLDRSGIKYGNKAHVYITVKAKIKAKEGLAFSTGIYDNVKGRRILDRDVKIQDIPDSKYHDYYLGEYTIEPGCFVYVASPGDDRLVEEVLVDRGFVIPSKKK